MKVTEDEYSRRVKLFTDKVFWWQKRLGFNEVEIHVFEFESENWAQWTSREDGMNVSIFYSKTWIENPSINDLAIDKCAFHEVFESQFYQIEKRLEAYYSEQYTAHMIHGIVRKAENSIFPIMRQE